MVQRWRYLLVISSTCYIKDYVIDIKPQAAVVKIAQPTYMRSTAFKLKYEQLFENKLKFC